MAQAGSVLSTVIADMAMPDAARQLLANPNPTAWLEPQWRAGAGKLFRVATTQHAFTQKLCTGTPGNWVCFHNVTIPNGVSTAEFVTGFCDHVCRRCPVCPRDKCEEGFTTTIDGARTFPWTNPDAAAITGARDPEAMVRYYLEVLELERVLFLAGMTLFEGHIAQCPPKIAELLDVAASLRSPSTVCEIGYNGGHSALAYMASLASAGTEAAFYSFDLGDHAYSFLSKEYVQRRFPAVPMHFITGPSQTTMVDLLHELAANGTAGSLRCDVFLVDGGHEFEQALADFMHARLLMDAKRPHVIMVDDVQSNYQAFNPGDAVPGDVWHAAIGAGMVKELRRPSCGDGMARTQMGIGVWV